MRERRERKSADFPFFAKETSLFLLYGKQVDVISASSSKVHTQIFLVITFFKKKKKRNEQKDHVETLREDDTINAKDKKISLSLSLGKRRGKNT